MSRSSEPKKSVKLAESKWQALIHFVTTDTQNMDAGNEAKIEMEEIITSIRDQIMSRSNRGKEPEEAAVLSPLEFSGVHGKTFAISSKEREPIEQLLPVLSGNILILTSWSPNTEGINSALRKGRDKQAIQRSISKIVEVQILCKTRNVKTAFDHVIIDRIDEIDNGKNKMDKAAQIKAMLILIPGLIGQANLFVTTMMGIPILYEGVDEHKVV